MARKKSRPRDKRASKQELPLRIEDIGDRIIPFPSTPPQLDPVPPKKSDTPPSRFVAEQVLRELHEALEDEEFSSKEELEAFMAAFNRRSMKPSTKGKPSRNRKQEAQDLAYRAMDTANPNRSAELCQKAIKLDPHCVDALMHLTRLACEDGDEMIEHMQMVVDIGERDLGGADYFEENAGYFWGLLETRPYMRARAYLAQLLAEAGNNDEAIRHYEEMLRLNPNDNQGLRYPLVGCYLLAENLEGARRLLKQFEDEGGAVLAWSLVLERYLSGDEDGATEALKEARRINKHAEKYLTGRKDMPKELPPYYGFGDENEALVCADAIGAAWKRQPKAVAWLKQAKR